MLHVFIIVGIILIILLSLWILSIRPNKITQDRREKMRPFEEVYIAHRGLFSNKGETPEEAPAAPENSLEAFRRAVEHGYGIEMDVQLTRDGQLVVFHDGTMKRMCGDPRNLYKCDYDDIKDFTLKGSDQHIPLFQEVRDLVAGQVPLLIEVKPDGNSRETARVLNEELSDYQGTYCIESFDPRAVNWYRKNRPDIARGQLSDKFKPTGILSHDLARRLCKNLSFNFYGRPDFIAYNQNHKNQRSYRLLRRLFPVYNAAWTIRSQDQLEAARDVFSIFIFDSFIPDAEQSVCGEKPETEER